jgi:hypothetical protein
MASKISLSSYISLLDSLSPIQQYVAYGFVRNWKQFLNVLRKLDRFIGYDNPNSHLVSNLMAMSVEYRRSGKPVNKEKLHVLILGPPGVGKSVYGELLAELLAVCGCTTIAQPTSSTPGQTTTKKQNDSTSIIHLQQIAVKNSQITSLQNIIHKMRFEALQSVTQLNHMRKKLQGKVPNPEFQNIKNSLRNMISNGGTSFQSINEILPLTIPRNPGHPNELQTNGMNQMLSMYVPEQIAPPLQTEATEYIRPKFVVLTRSSFVGKWQGHTSDKVKELLKEYEGGVIMIDEAYSMITSETDSFGKEAMTEIIHYMTTYPDKITFIFAGYRKEIEEGILKIQPGLRRRFKYIFEIDGYTPNQLSSILKLQMQNHELHLADDAVNRAEKLIADNKELFKHFGGDTEKFSDFIRTALYRYAHEFSLNNLLSQAEFISKIEVITPEIINSAFEDYKNNCHVEVDPNKESKDIPDHVKQMYC